MPWLGGTVPGGAARRGSEMPGARRNTARPRRRAGRRRLALWLLCVVLLLAPRGDSVRSLSAEVRVAAVPLAPPALQRQASKPEVAPPEPVPTPLGPQELDRCWGAIAAARDALLGGRLSVAMASVELLGPVERDAQLRGARAELERDLEAEFTAWLSGLDGLLGEGQVPAAAQRLALACTPVSHRRVVERVNGWARAHGWPIFLDTPPASPDLPAANPLPDGAVLQVWFAERWAEASVVSCAADSVTVRLATPDGVVFPTFARETVAPRSLGFASEQAVAALRARNWSLAALWCAASLRAGRSLEPELARVIEPWCR